MSKIVREFMNTHGYINMTSDFGIRRQYKRRSDWTYDAPEDMLKKFHKFLKTKEE